MDYYLPIKHIHMLTAYLTVALFVLRLGLDVAGKPGWRATPLRFLPHINDTILLTAAVALLAVGPFQLFVHHWLTLKVVLLVGYIVAGVFAMKPQYKVRVRAIAAVLALVQVLVIFHLAMAKPMFG